MPSTKQHIVELLELKGYEVMEATWVNNPNGGFGGYWAATFKVPGTMTIQHTIGPYLGAILDRIMALPNADYYLERDADLEDAWREHQGVAVLDAIEFAEIETASEPEDEYGVVDGDALEANSSVVADFEALAHEAGRLPLRFRREPTGHGDYADET